VTNAAWLVVAIVAGAAFAVGWLKREQWIHRRASRKK
jgi:hypothetical protein